MRYAGILSLALSAALLPLGCDSNTSSTPPTNSKMSNAKEKIEGAADATAEAAKEKRDEYTREMSKRLAQFDVKCKELEVRITKVDGQAKKDLEKKLEEAKVKCEAAAKKLDELKETGADRWEKVKEGVGSALDDLKNVFE
jgi:signal recognition particle GTPase